MKILGIKNMKLIKNKYSFQLHINVYFYASKKLNKITHTL
jgi:hypothetical protein